MKSLIAFYTICILMFYSLIVYIGNRNKNSINGQSTGLLKDVTLPSTDYKISKARLLAQNFDNAIIYTKMEDKKLAADEIHKAITLFTNNFTISENYEMVTMDVLLKNLCICYISLKHKTTPPLNMNKVFESSELFFAYGYIHKSQCEFKHNNTISALENITKAQECLALSAKYAKNQELKTHIILLDDTKQLINQISNQGKK